MWSSQGPNSLSPVPPKSMGESSEYAWDDIMSTHGADLKASIGSKKTTTNVVV